MRQVDTLILRFRDLGNDDTVKEHNKIISDNGYVWWGWWGKPGERIPRDLFSKLFFEGSNSKELKLYLFDSGNKKIYKAICIEASYSIKDEKIKVPDKNIPEYYKNYMCLCWFKFTKIDNCGVEEIRDYSYVNIKDFFIENYNDGYSLFDNKIVFGVDELFFQQRTMWFISRFIKEDKTNEIIIYSPSQFVPMNYEKDFLRMNQNTLLWLSDLHFSCENDKGSYHQYDKNGVDKEKLKDILIKELEKNEVVPSGVIVSGDLVYKAKAEEFEKAKEFLNHLKSIYGLKTREFSIVPGNHDFSFKLENDSLEVKYLEQQYSKAYREFYEDFFKCTPSKHFSSIRRMYTYNMRAIEIINVNSVALQQIKVSADISNDGKEHSFVGLGYVGKEQIDELEEELKITKDANVVRILVLHHHLLPVMYSEIPQIDKTYSLLLDAGRVQKFIFDNNIDIVLHGHAHKGFYRIISHINEKNERKDCHIVGLGSAGVINQELTEDAIRMYATIEFEKENVLIRKYRMDRYESTDCMIDEHRIKV